MLPFSVTFEIGTPASDQLVQAVRKAILTGQLKPGERFPSVRTLSQELRISPTTAHKAVARLKEQGYLGSQPGVGMIVLAPELPSRQQRIQHLLPACTKLLQEAEELQLELDDLIEALRQAADKQRAGKLAPEKQQQRKKTKPGKGTKR